MPQRKAAGAPRAGLGAADPEYHAVEAGTFYAFSAQSARPARRNALVVLFSAAVLFFAAFAASKIPFIAARAARGLPVEFSANLAAIGMGTGVETTTSWTFLVPHIAVAVLLEVLFALIMLRRVRMSTPWVRRGVFALTVVHCVLIVPNWRGLPGPAGNVMFVSICLLAALQLQFVDGKSQLGFSWLVLAVNSGPVGEVAFWLIKLRERLLTWREASLAVAAAAGADADVPSPSPAGFADAGGGDGGGGGAAAAAAVDPSLPTSMGYGVLLALGILACVLVVLVFVLVAVYNIWFFTVKHGALPRSLFAWTRGT